MKQTPIITKEHDMAQYRQDMACTDIGLGAKAPKRGGFWQWLVGLDTAHRERASLARLSDATLRDVGLNRDDIARESGKSAWNAPDFWLK